jgi:hypothetical protein
MSRTPSLGLPSTDCHAGLAYPAQVPLTTPVVDGAPVAQPLGPPLPAWMLTSSPLLQVLSDPIVEGNPR